MRKQERAKLREMSWEMADMIGGCYCEPPPPGESGDIECISCSVKRWRQTVLEILGKA